MGFILFYFFSFWLCCPLRFQNSPQTHWWEGFLVFGNFSSFKTPSPGWISIPNSFVSLFIFSILSYLLLKTTGCLSGCLVSSTSIQKLFCGICSAFKWSFDEFVWEKVVSPSYSSILGPPLSWRFILYSSSVYSCLLFLIASVSVRSKQFLSFIEPIFIWNVPLVSLNFLEEIASLSHSIIFLYFFALITEKGFLISPCHSLEFCIPVDISFPFSIAFSFSSFLSYL